MVISAQVEAKIGFLRKSAPTRSDEVVSATAWERAQGELRGASHGTLRRGYCALSGLEDGQVNDLSFGGFLLRAVLSLLLVLLTFNPSGYSYVHLVADGFPSISPVEAVLGILLLIGWIVFLGATLKSIGLVGMVLAFALCAALIWMIVSWGWVSLENTSALTWIGLVVLALIMAIGMAWAHLYRRWTGQATVDEVKEGQ
ncbi:DUF6524 family protein [Steroidobacter sp.]|uniref:DUF6524 family protein n=1 Tax=Steroidobacter sp. TaxID=1978227 RepID=UPI001A4321C9|nr:DUF6524 family protein [Steroidobacter sp.]MBL8266595.1 hypothetical protein [Steroidobacter sp.]